MNAINPVELDMVEVMPILPSLNFSETSDFYVNALGFESKPAVCDDYIVFRRGRMELHFWNCADPLLSVNSSVFVRCDAVGGLFDEFTARGVNGLVRIEDEEGMDVERFYVRDPHGNLLMFGRRETASL